MNPIRIAAALGIAAFIAPVAQAGHIKPGLWDVTATTTYPDESKLPQVIVGRMRAQGMEVPSGKKTKAAKVCLSAEDAAADKLPRLADDDTGCDWEPFETTADGFAGKAVCKSYLTGRLWYGATFLDDAHYKGNLVFRGKLYGIDLDNETKISGAWLAADCGAAP